MNRLWVRLTAAILLVAWIVLAVVTLVIHQAIDTSFRQYVGAAATDLFDPVLLEELQNYYAAHGSWAGVDALLPVMGHGMGERRGRGGIEAFIAAPDGRIVASTDNTMIGSTLADLDAYQSAPLVIGSDVVGTVGQQTQAVQA